MIMFSLMISMDRTADWEYSSCPSVGFNALAVADDSDTAAVVKLSDGAQTVPYPSLDEF